MANKVFTAPKAFIKIQGKVAGYIRDLSFTENIQRAEIAGLGSLVNQEVPAVKQTNQFSIGEFFIDFSRPATKALLDRTDGVTHLLNTLSLGEFSFNIMIFSKTMSDTNGDKTLITSINPAGKEIATLTDCFLDSQSFNLSEAGIAGLSSTGRYLTPVTFK